MADELSGKRVLIVEDDSLLHGLLVKNLSILTAKGMVIDAAVDGSDALQKAQAAHPDLIILDLVLPTMSGFEFLEKARQEKGLEKTPVLLLTNLNTDADRERARSLGVLAYLVKADFSLSEIAATVEDFLLGKQAHIPTAREPKVEWSSNKFVVHL